MGGDLSIWKSGAHQIFCVGCGGWGRKDGSREQDWLDAGGIKTGMHVRTPDVIGGRGE